MEINQVKFGNYSLNGLGARQKDLNRKPEEKQAQNLGGENQQQKSADEMFAALNMAGIHNRVQINRAQNKKVNPADYLSEERIADIEAMMEGFETGVNNISELVGQEFPNMSEANKNTIAARIFAQG